MRRLCQLDKQKGGSSQRESLSAGARVTERMTQGIERTEGPRGRQERQGDSMKQES